MSKSSVLDTVVVPRGVALRSCKPLSGRVDVCNERYGYNSWLGVAGISTSGSHITKAYVKLNDSYFSTRTYNTPVWRNLVMCQEVGHALGLDHQDEVFNNANLGSCMDYTNDPSTNQHPNQHDCDQLEAIYYHLDGTTKEQQVEPRSFGRRRASSHGWALGDRRHLDTPTGRRRVSFHGATAEEANNKMFQALADQAKWRLFSDPGR